MRKAIISLLVITSLFSCKYRAENPVSKISEKDYNFHVQKKEISLIFVGDVMAHSPQISGARIDSANNRYDFSDCFKYVAPFWKSADAVIANLETTLSDGPYSGYPMFAAPKSLAEALKNSGVTHFALANNHTCDKFSKGITSTTNYLEELDIPYMGAFQDSTLHKLQSPMYIKKSGFNIALLNYTYGTNGINIPKGMVVPFIDTTSIAEDIKKCKRGFATNIIVFIHWGEEYQRKESKYQREIADWLEKKGVDIIIGSHPHVVQPMICDSSKVKVFSLGNFISNQRQRYTNGGINVKITITNDNNKMSYDTSYKSFYVYKTDKKPRYFCLDSLAADTIITEDFERKMAKQFFDDTNNLLAK